LLAVLSLARGLTWYIFRAGTAISSVTPPLNLVAGLPAALLAVPAAVVAVAFGLRRYLAYAAALFWSALPVILLDLHPGWAFIPAGVLSLTLGSRLLTQFVRNYPREA